MTQALTLEQSNYKAIWDLVENGNNTELQKIFNNKNVDNILAFLKYQNPDESKNTALHIAFENVANIDEAIITLLTTKLSKEQLTEVLNIENEGGINSILKVSGDADFTKVMNLFGNEKKKAILLSAAVNKETALHVWMEEGEEGLVDALFAQASALTYMKEVLEAKNGQDDTATHVAILQNKHEFVKKVFEKASTVDVLSIKGENDNTVAHLGFASQNADVKNLIITEVEKIGDLSTLLNTVNTGGIKVIDKLFDNDAFIEMFGKFNDKKGAILDSIVANILSASALGGVDEDDKTALQGKITALWNAIEAITGENADTIKSDLKKKLLGAVDLGTADYTAIDFFGDDIIKAKLQAVEKGIADTVNALSGENIIATALKDNALDKISGYATNFADKLPDNFGDSTKAAVKDALDKVVDAQKTVIGAESVTDKDGLETAYTTAKEKIEGFKEVYKAVDSSDKTTCAEITLCKAAIDSLNEAVLKSDGTGKAVDIVNGVCKDDYSTESGDTEAKVQAATDCKNLIEGFKASNDLKDIVGTDFAKTQLEGANTFIGANTVDNEGIKEGAGYFSVALKDIIVFSTIAKKYEAWDDNSANLRKFMFNFKPEFFKDKKYPGINADKPYNKVYHQDKLGKDINAGHNVFLKNIYDIGYKDLITANKDKSIKKACEGFKIDASSCTFDALKPKVKEHFCVEANKEKADYKFLCNPNKFDYTESTKLDDLNTYICSKEFDESHELNGYTPTCPDVNEQQAIMLDASCDCMRYLVHVGC